jgi:hypothetical protein
MHATLRHIRLRENLGYLATTIGSKIETDYYIIGLNARQWKIIVVDYYRRLNKLIGYTRCV